MRGCQCTKSLWLYKNHFELRDEISDDQQSIFSQGADVGKLAQQLFPGGVDASPETPFEFQQSVADTTKFINDGNEVIYEAAFQFDEVLAALDILVKREGGWYGYEVKSSTQINDIYIRDAALQYYVITNSGILLADIFIVHINNKYVRQGELDIHELFTIVSVKEAALALQAKIAMKIPEFKKIISLEKCPVTDIGGHCSTPYGCDFHGYCWQHIPDESVFDLRGIGHFKKSMELYKQGILKMADIPHDFPLNKAMRTQVDLHINKQMSTNKDAIKKFLTTLHYPLYFMDFETFCIAVPEYNSSWPYQHVPFQFSLHILEKPGATLQHKEFLADTCKDPRIDFIAELLAHIGSAGSVVVYNKAFECRILNEIAISFPHYKKEMENILQRIVDLMKPFRNRHYYHHLMQGSYSIKKVLPALIPEMKYDEMDISNGSMASHAFANLQHETDPEKINQTRRQLLEYCGLDTLAMVKILEKSSRRLRPVLPDGVRLSHH